MARAKPNAPCPCGSERKAKHCCARLHRGSPPGDDAVALMRSRYCAYRLGLVDYIIETTHPFGPRWRPDTEVWRAELVGWCAATSFDALTVTGSGIDPDGVAWVSFVAQLTQEGRSDTLTERSRFQDHEGRLRYFDGAVE